MDIPPNQNPTDWNFNINDKPKNLNVFFQYIIETNKENYNTSVSLSISIIGLKILNQSKGFEKSGLSSLKQLNAIVFNQYSEDKEALDTIKNINTIWNQEFPLKSIEPNPSVGVQKQPGRSFEQRQTEEEKKTLNSDDWDKKGLEKNDNYGEKTIPPELEAQNSGKSETVATKVASYIYSEIKPNNYSTTTITFKTKSGEIKLTPPQDIITSFETVDLNLQTSRENYSLQSTGTREKQGNTESIIRAKKFLNKLFSEIEGSDEEIRSIANLVLALISIEGLAPLQTLLTVEGFNKDRIINPIESLVSNKIIVSEKSIRIITNIPCYLDKKEEGKKSTHGGVFEVVQTVSIPLPVSPQSQSPSPDAELLFKEEREKAFPKTPPTISVTISDKFQTISELPSFVAAKEAKEAKEIIADIAKLKYNLLPKKRNLFSIFSKPPQEITEKSKRLLELLKKGAVDANHLDIVKDFAGALESSRYRTLKAFGKKLREESTRLSMNLPKKRNLFSIFSKPPQ